MTTISSGLIFLDDYSLSLTSEFYNRRKKTALAIQTRKRNTRKNGIGSNQVNKRECVSGWCPLTLAKLLLFPCLLLVSGELLLMKREVE